MKANELMIGDWVLFSGEPKRVKSIVVSDNGVERIYVFGSTCQVSTIEAYIQPIPLTQEILEKNGFKDCNCEQWSLYKYKDDDYTKQSLYQVLWSKNEQYLEITSYTSHTGEYNRMGVLFVHELQHALKLCGIEKTIEL